MFKILDQIVLEEAQAMARDHYEARVRTMQRLADDPALNHLCRSSAKSQMAYFKAGMMNEDALKFMIGMYIVCWEKANHRFNEQLTGPENKENGQN